MSGFQLGLKVLSWPLFDLTSFVRENKERFPKLCIQLFFFLFSSQYLEKRFSVGVRMVGCVFFILEYVSIETSLISN